MFECIRFNRRSQQDGELAEQYITVHYGLAADCEYGPLKEEMIRDKLHKRYSTIRTASTRCELDTGKGQSGSAQKKLFMINNRS